MKMKTRPLEMAVCYSDGTWQAEFFVDVPADTAENDLESVGAATLQGLWDKAFALSPRPLEAPEVTHIFLYNSIDDEAENE